MTESIRVDLFAGAVYGLTLSAGLWTVILMPPPAEPGCLLLLALSTALGALRLRVPLLRRVSPTYPALLAALLLFGPGASIAAAALSATSRVLAGHRAYTKARIRRPAFEIGRSTLAAAVAAGAFLLLDDAIRGLPALALPVATGAHALCHALVGGSLTRIARHVSGRRGLPRVALGRSLRGVAAQASAVSVAIGVASIWPDPGARASLISAIFFLLAAAHYHWHDRLYRMASAHGRKSDALYRSITEALAKTMEAKDPHTQDHLRRVRVVCVEVGRRLGLRGSELDALSAAAVLHDLGKVAVPEGILNKPGRLTDEEMECMKLHPGAGADILESIPFPYPLGSIVRHHHERWDGSGYPAGLRGEDIPLGSRILSAVDSYDALTSDRPYRKALSHEETLTFLRRESGHMFDGRVVDALLDHLESVQGVCALTVLSKPQATTEWDESLEEPVSGRSLSLAQLELQTLYEITRAVDYGLALEEYLTLVSGKLAAIVPYRSLVVYFLDSEAHLLRAGFALGQAADKLRLMTIPLGERLSGYAAQQRRALIGRDHLVPLERDGSRSDLEDWENDDEIALLASTIVAPMVSGDRLVGVLTLYDEAGRTYSAEHRRILTRVAGSVAERTANIDGHVPPAEASLTDPLTGVPNARFLWLETAHRLAQPEPGFGILAFRVVGIERATERLGNRAADRLLCQLARRFAAGCGENETLVRFGHDLFLVLTGVNRPGELVERWHDLAAGVEIPPLDAGEGALVPIRLLAAHAACPADGTEMDALLRALDARLVLTSSRGRTVLAFRPARASRARGA